MTTEFDQSLDERVKLGKLLKQGICPACGQQAFQEPPAVSESFAISCMACGETFMVDLCREAWV